MCTDRPNLVAANDHLHRQVAELRVENADLRAQLAAAQRELKETRA